MTEKAPQLLYDMLLIALGVLVPAALLTGPRIIKKRREKCARRAGLEQKRDETLAAVLEKLDHISDGQETIKSDVRCLYRSQIPQLDSLEITLRALKKEKINGNVTDALGKIQEAKSTINARLCERVGCAEDEG